MSLKKENKMKLHGQARGISKITGFTPRLHMERNPAPKTISAQVGYSSGMTSTRVNPWASGAWIKEVLISEKRIKERIKKLGVEISREYSKKEVLLVAVLDGSIVFLSDLIRELKINFSIDFISVSSYEGSKSSGKINILKEMRNDPSGKDVLLVEDIVDTGFTLDQVRRSILSKNPSSLKICVLLDKSDARKIPVNIDYLGFKIPKQFVVGYGLDYNGKHRGLPFIGIFK